MFDDKTICGVVGTVISATGASLSVNEVQAIVSIVVTVLGFLLGVVLPWVLKIVAKVKKAKEDGKVTAEELQDIADTAKEAADDIKENLPKK